MSRRTVLLCGLFAAVSLSSSTGCCGWRPFLWRWNCGDCWPQCYNPPPVGPAMSAPVMAAPEVCSPCLSGPVIGGAPSECACFSPPSGPIAVSPPAAAPVYNAPPTYTVPPPVFSGQPSTLINPPKVMKENPMTSGGSK